MPTADLAFIDADGALRLRPAAPLGPAGKAETPARFVAAPHPSRLRYYWPTWAPGGAALAVSVTGYAADRDPVNAVHLYSRDAPHGSRGMAPLFETGQDPTVLIAPAIAHYVSWSPRADRLAVVAQSGAGLEMTLLARERPEGSRIIARGGSLYGAWAADGAQVAVHAGADLYLVDADTDAVAMPRRVISALPTYRRPEWSADGERLIYAAPLRGGRNALWWTTREALSPPQVLTELPGPVAFLRRPGSDLLAIVTVATPTAPTRELRLFDPETRRTEPVLGGPIAAMFWSPSGDHLFLLRPQEPATDVALLRVTPANGQTVRLAAFRPSPAFATYLAFFDQFAGSHPLVTPDGQWITFAGIAWNNGAGAAMGGGAKTGVYVVPADGSAPPRRISAGELSTFPPPATAR